MWTLRDESLRVGQSRATVSSATATGQEDVPNPLRPIRDALAGPAPSVSKEADRAVLQEIAQRLGPRIRSVMNAWLDGLELELPTLGPKTNALRSVLWMHVQESAKFLRDGDLEGWLAEWARIGRRFYDSDFPLASMFTVKRVWDRSLIKEIVDCFPEPEQLKHALEVYDRWTTERLLAWVSVYTSASAERIKSLEEALQKKTTASYDKSYWVAFNEVFGETTGRVLQALLQTKTAKEPGPEWHRVQVSLQSMLGPQALAVLTLADRLASKQ